MTALESNWKTVEIGKSREESEKNVGKKLKRKRIRSRNLRNQILNQV